MRATNAAARAGNLLGYRHLHILLAVAMVLGCGLGTEPEDVVPLLRAYQYRLVLPVSAEQGDGRTCTGRFTVTAASRDSVAGTWGVPFCVLTNSSGFAPGFQPASLLGFWNVDAYVVWARPTVGGQIVHRFAKNRQGLLSCASAGRVTSDGTINGTVAVPATECRLTLVP